MRLWITIVHVLSAHALAHGASAAHQHSAQTTTTSQAHAPAFPSSLRFQPLAVASLEWRSNLLLIDEVLGLPIEDDTLATLKIGGVISLGDEDSRLMFNLDAGADVVRLATFTRYDQTTPYFDFDARYDDALVAFALTAAHEESSLPTEDFQASVIIRNRIEDRASATLRHQTTEMTELVAALHFGQIDYSGPDLRRPLGDTTTAASLEARHAFSELLYLGPGLRTTRRDTEDHGTTDDLVGYLSASWEVSPATRVGSRTGFGVTEVLSDGGSKTFGFVVLNASTAVRDTLDLSASIGRDLDVDIYGGLIVKDTASLTARWFPADSLVTILKVLWDSDDPLETTNRQSTVNWSLTQVVSLRETITLHASVGSLINRGTLRGTDYASTNLSLSLQAAW